MVFSSPIFLFVFFPLAAAIYLIAPKNSRNITLLAASMIFYYWGSGSLILLLLFSIAINYMFGIGIGSMKEGRKKHYLFVFALMVNLGLLFYYKYLNFAILQLNHAFKFLPLPQVSNANVLLPIGISFFTFHALSYLIDLYRGKVKTEKNPVDFALYIALFPQLIAGPIIRYIQISGQIKSRTISVDKIYSGLLRFIIGLGKKVIIADQLGGVADKIMNLAPDQLSFSLSWAGIICFALQIYMDFSAYSDMAIGLGRIFGFDILENFNYPYISKSITEFWRRWHISLSTWFRDYLYIPLGGNRLSPMRTYFNLWIVFVLCGIWHGASWNFLIWGIYHGLFLVLERAFLKRRLESLPSGIGHFYTIFVVCTSWVFFRIGDFSHAIIYLKAMLVPDLGGSAYSVFEFMNIEIFLYLAAAVIFSIPSTSSFFKDKIGSRISERFPIVSELAYMSSSAVLLFYSILMIAKSSYRPFIYFKF